jgi:hypothetical protein
LNEILDFLLIYHHFAYPSAHGALPLDPDGVPPLSLALRGGSFTIWGAIGQLRRRRNALHAASPAARKPRTALL